MKKQRSISKPMEKYHEILINKYIEPYIPMYSGQTIKIHNVFSKQYKTIYYMYKKDREIYAIERNNNDLTNTEISIKYLPTDVIEQIANFFVDYEPMKYVYATFVLFDENIAVKCESIEICKAMLSDIKEIPLAEHIEMIADKQIVKDNYKIISIKKYKKLFKDYED